MPSRPATAPTPLDMETLLPTSARLLCNPATECSCPFLADPLLVALPKVQSKCSRNRMDHAGRPSAGVRSPFWTAIRCLYPHQRSQIFPTRARATCCPSYSFDFRARSGPSQLLSLTSPWRPRCLSPRSTTSPSTAAGDPYDLGLFSVRGVRPPAGRRRQARRPRGTDLRVPAGGPTLFSTIHSITFDCTGDPYDLGLFWSELLGRPLADDDKPGDPEALIAGPGRRAEAAVHPGARRASRSRTACISTCDRTDAPGTRRSSAWSPSAPGVVADHRRPDGSGWVLMADPEGNEFCVERGELG